MDQRPRVGDQFRRRAFARALHASIADKDPARARDAGTLLGSFIDDQSSFIDNQARFIDNRSSFIGSQSMCDYPVD